MFRQSLRCVIALGAGLGLASTVAAHGDLEIGRSDTNQIVIHFHDEPFELPPSSLPGFNGYSDTHPAFVSLEEDEPAENLFMLPATSNVQIVFVSAGPHIQIWDDNTGLPMVAGDTYALGQPEFHEHPIWHSPDGTEGEVYSLQLQVRDVSGQLSDSAVYTISFTPVPEPTTGFLLGLGALLAFRRR